MNRCFPRAVSHIVSHSRRAVLVWALLAAPLAWGQVSQTVRNFPATAQRGAFIVTAPPEVQLDGKPARLSPGARIWGADRMLVLSGRVVGQRLLVNYTRDAYGLISEVWILNPDEAKLPAPASPR